MKTKILDRIVMIVIIIVGMLYWRSSVALGTGTSANIGSGFYPSLLAMILLLLTLVKLLQTLRTKDEEKIQFPNGKLVLFTMGAIALFILSWSFIGYFYIHLFLFIFFLYSVYSERLKKQFIMKNAFLSLAVTISIFIIFDLVLHLSLS